MFLVLRPHRIVNPALERNRASDDVRDGGEDEYPEQQGDHYQAEAADEIYRRRSLHGAFTGMANALVLGVMLAAAVASSACTHCGPSPSWAS